MTQAYQQAFRHLFDGTVEQYDPWDAAHRTAGPQYPGSTMCSAFRTFQGWTALSDMDHDQGVLHTVPIPEAMALPDAAPAARRRRPTTTCAASPSTRSSRPARSGTRCCCEALTGIPDVQAGDSVWWHCDMIHSVAPVDGPAGLGQRHVHPRRAVVPAQRGATPRSVREAFLTGSSPSDFPEEHYEREWPDRFTVDAAQRRPAAEGSASTDCRRRGRRGSA